MITEDYCSYEVAKLLKEKGFIGTGDVGCRCGLYVQNKDYPSEIGLAYDDLDNTELEWNECLRPTHQMAMKWLREVHKVLIVIDAYRADHWEGYIDSFEIDILHGASRIIVPHEIAIHTNYEEAVEAALKYSLENLI